MMWYHLVAIAVVLFCTIGFAVNLYRIIVLDAKSRGMRFPKLWGVVGTGQEGLLVYFLARRKYPQNLSDEDRQTLAGLKGKASGWLLAMCVTFVAFLATVIFGNGFA